MEQDRLTQFSEALRAASKVFDTTGEVFFRSLTEHLGAVLRVDYVSIGELCEGESSFGGLGAHGKNLTRG